MENQMGEYMEPQMDLQAEENIAAEEITQELPVDEVNAAEQSAGEWHGEEWNTVPISQQNVDKSSLRKQRMKAFLRSGKKIALGYGSEDLIGRDYREVQTLLLNRAFNNVRLEAIKDITEESYFTEYVTVQVLVEEREAFTAEEEVPYNAPIVIVYHEKKEVVVPVAAKNMRNMRVKKAMEWLQELGFTNVTKEPIKDLSTGIVVKARSVESVSIGGVTDFRKNTAFKYDVPVVVSYHTFKFL